MRGSNVGGDDNDGHPVLMKNLPERSQTMFTPTSANTKSKDDELNPDYFSIPIANVPGGYTTAITGEMQ